VRKPKYFMRPILAIEKDEVVFIPKKYHKVNDLCAIIYDQLTEIYKQENYSLLTYASIPIEKGKKKFMKELKNGELHILDWLNENNYTNEIDDFLTKHLTLRIASDFLNFMFESLHCAKRGKMTVAYALLRKPLTDELLILEQLLVDNKDFISRFFHSGNPDEYDPSNKIIEKKKIISEAISQIRIGFFNSADLIYDLRYNKECESGINGISNHALHIVTRDKNYKTSNQNLNFIFSEPEDFERYYDHYYNFVPLLLIYAVSIIDELIFKFLPDKSNQNLKVVKEFRRLIGYFLLSEYLGLISKKENDKLFSKLGNSITYNCEKCGKTNSLKRKDFIRFFETEDFYCNKCGAGLLNSDDDINVLDKIMNFK